MRHLIFILGVATLGATICSGTEVYGYTGQDPNGGSTQDQQFVIITNTIDNKGSPEGGTGLPNFDAYYLDASSVAADGYTSLLLPQGGDASWVGPQADQTVGLIGGGPTTGFCCNGTTTYDVQVDLSSLNLASTSLELILAADDVVSVTLNGNGIYAGTAPMYGATTTVGPFDVSGDDLVDGLNTLNFVVTNAGGPTGLDAYFQFQDAVPEPQTFTLMGLGLAGLGAMRWRRRQG